MVNTDSSKGNMFYGIQCRIMKFVDLIIDNQSNGAVSGLPQK
jgi:hypothetical protein